MKKLNLIFILCILSILIFKNSLALQRSHLLQEEVVEAEAEGMVPGG
jgi:hypothetical protein